MSFIRATVYIFSFGERRNFYSTWLRLVEHKIVLFTL